MLLHHLLQEKQSQVAVVVYRSGIPGTPFIINLELFDRTL